MLRTPPRSMNKGWHTNLIVIIIIMDAASGSKATYKRIENHTVHTHLDLKE